MLPDVLHLFLPHGLQQVVLGPEADALEDGLGVLVGGHHHDRDGPQGSLGSDVAQQLDAVDVGHHDVGEDEVEVSRRVGAELLYGLESRLDVGDLIFFFFFFFS